MHDYDFALGKMALVRAAMSPNEVKARLARNQLKKLLVKPGAGSGLRTSVSKQAGAMTDAAGRQVKKAAGRGMHEAGKLGKEVSYRAEGVKRSAENLIKTPMPGGNVITGRTVGGTAARVAGVGAAGAGGVGIAGAMSDRKKRREYSAADDSLTYFEADVVFQAASRKVRPTRELAELNRKLDAYFAEGSKKN